MFTLLSINSTFSKEETLRNIYREDMKKRILLLTMCIMCAFGLSACTDDEERVMEGDVVIDETEEEKEVLEEPADSDSAQITKAVPQEIFTGDRVVVHDDRCAWAIYSDNSVKQLISVSKEDAYVCSAGSFGEYMYMLVNCYTSSDSSYTVYIFDDKGNRRTSYDVFDGTVNCRAQVYDGKLYLANEMYVNGTSEYKVFEYNPQSNGFMVNYKYRKITENIKAEYDFIKTDMTVFDLLNSNGPAYVKDFANKPGLYSVDTETGTIKSKMVLPDEVLNSNYYFSDQWGKWLVLNIYASEDNGENLIYLFDPDTYDLQLLGKGTLTFLQGTDKYCYWYERQEEAYNVVTYKLMRFDSETGNIENLWTKGSEPGGSGYYVAPGISGFGATEDKLYYEDYGDSNVVWKCCDPDGSNEETLGIVVHDYEWADYVTISADVVTDYYEDSTDLKYGYYIEKPVVNNDIPNAEKINAVIDSYYKELTDAALQCRENRLFDTESEEAEYIYYCANDVVVQDVRKIGRKYLTMDIHGYDYTGGVHGMPYRMHWLFDLDTGKEVQFRDICGVDENEYRDLVSEKTYQDALKGAGKYYSDLENSDEEIEFIGEVYDDTFFETWRIRYEEYGIIVEFPPYTYGPYAAGFIEIPISYEELCMEINGEYLEKP